MQFQIQRAVLNEALTRLTAATDFKSPGAIEKNSHLKIEAFPGEGAPVLRISAYSGLINVEAAVGCQAVDEPFVACVSKAMFASIVDSLPDGELTLRVQDPHAVVRSAKSQFKLNTLADHSLLPTLGYQDRDYGSLDVAAFVRGLASVSYCRSDKPLRDFFAMTYVDGETFASTDGLRIALFPQKAFACTSFMLLTPDVARHLGRLFTGLGTGGISTDGSMLYLASGGLYAGARLIDSTKVGAYPNFRAVLPSGPCGSFTVGRKALIDVLRRVTLVMGKAICVVDLRFNQTQLSLSCRAEAGDAGTEQLEIKGDAEGAVLLDGHFLLEGLAHMEADEVKVHYRGPERAIDVTDGEHRNVIQPTAAQ